jgi:lycopene cyclase domain-containing protein
VTHYLYLAILLGCLLAPIGLEFTLRVRVLARWHRLAATVAPVFVVFATWDAVAVQARQWTYASRWILGARVLGRLPIEELVFFVVIPICAVATLEAVRRCRPAWVIGDEPVGDRR